MAGSGDDGPLESDYAATVPDSAPLEGAPTERDAPSTARATPFLSEGAEVPTERDAAPVWSEPISSESRTTHAPETQPSVGNEPQVAVTVQSAVPPAEGDAVNPLSLTSTLQSKLGTTHLATDKPTTATGATRARLVGVALVVLGLLLIAAWSLRKTDAVAAPDHEASEPVNP